MYVLRNQTKSDEIKTKHPNVCLLRNQTKSDKIGRNQTKYEIKPQCNPNVRLRNRSEIETKSNHEIKPDRQSSAAFLKPSWFLHWVAGHVRFSCVRCSPSWSLHIVFADVVLCRRPSLQYALWSCSVLVCSLQTSFVVFAHCVCRRCALQNMGCRSCSLADVLRGLCTLCLQRCAFTIWVVGPARFSCVLWRRPSLCFANVLLQHAVNVVVCSSCSYVLSDVLRALQHAGPAPSCFLFFWFCTKFS